MQFILDHVLRPLLGQSAAASASAPAALECWAKVSALPTAETLPFVPGCAHALDSRRADVAMSFAATASDSKAAVNAESDAIMRDASEGTQSPASAMSSSLRALSLANSVASAATSSTSASSNISGSAFVAGAPQQWHELNGFAHGNFARAADYVRAPECDDGDCISWGNRIYWPASRAAWVSFRFSLTLSTCDVLTRISQQQIAPDGRPNLLAARSKVRLRAVCMLYR